MPNSPRDIRIRGSVLIPRAERTPLHVVGSTEFRLSSAVHALIENISTSGCLFSCELDLPFGTQIAVDIPPIGRHAAIVRRTDGSRRGAAFLIPLTPGDIDAVVAVDQTQAKPVDGRRIDDPPVANGMRGILKMLVERLSVR